MQWNTSATDQVSPGVRNLRCSAVSAGDVFGMFPKNWGNDDEMIQFDKQIFSSGLVQPPTSIPIWGND